MKIRPPDSKTTHAPSVDRRGRTPPRGISAVVTTGVVGATGVLVTRPPATPVGGTGDPVTRLVPEAGGWTGVLVTRPPVTPVGSTGVLVTRPLPVAVGGVGVDVVNPPVVPVGWAGVPVTNPLAVPVG